MVVWFVCLYLRHFRILYRLFGCFTCFAYDIQSEGIVHYLVMESVIYCL
jgi:hypothetical protein